MFKRKRKIRIRKEPNVFIKALKENFSRILLFTIAFLMIISIAWEFFKDSENIDIKSNNKKTLEEYSEDLEGIYRNQNPKHNTVRIWVLNYTSPNYHKRSKLASKVTDCLQKGYELNGVEVEGNYNVIKQETLSNKDKNCPYCTYDMEKDNLDIDIRRGRTMIIYHNTQPDFDDKLAEFLSFTGFRKEIVYRNNQKYLLDERDITIILGDDWDDSNLQYCLENKNNRTTN
tara:strand:- start:593 stop:1282 length:690 start_codon:yes stop_codon:yes gene_type:complete